MASNGTNEAKFYSSIRRGPRKQPRIPKDRVKQVSVMMPTALLDLLDTEYTVRGWSKAEVIRVCVGVLLDHLNNGTLDLSEQHTRDGIRTLFQYGDNVMLNTYLYIDQIRQLDVFATLWPGLNRSDLLRYAAAKFGKTVSEKGNAKFADEMKKKGEERTRREMERKAIRLAKARRKARARGETMPLTRKEKAKEKAEAEKKARTSLKVKLAVEEREKLQFISRMHRRKKEEREDWTSE